MAKAGETLILDGYTVTATIPATGPWPEVKFKYRPMLADESAEFRDSPARGKERVKKIKAAILAHAVSWDVQKPGSSSCEDTVPINDEWLSRTPLVHLEDMVTAITGYSTLQQIIDVKN